MNHGQFFHKFPNHENTINENLVIYMDSGRLQGVKRNFTKTDAKS